MINSCIDERRYAISKIAFPLFSSGELHFHSIEYVEERCRVASDNQIPGVTYVTRSGNGTYPIHSTGVKRISLATLYLAHYGEQIKTTLD